jgi:hypothetical protein
MVAQFSNSISGCFTFGPDENLSLNPDLEKRAMNGMVPGTIVFHAAREDRAANELFMRLGNLLPLKRSFEVPSPSERARIYSIPNPGREDVIWLQFGTNVQWNSFHQ